ncbi:MAG: diacylglycerol kinase family protein [Chloroflexales bacterium]
MSCRHTLEPPPRRRIDRGMRSLIASFGYAFAGLWHMICTQRNAQIHVLAGACAVALGFTLRLERWEWLALVLIIALVLAAEGVNTAIEAAVDLATSAHHPLAKVAKDVAAGTVLICAIAAVIIGCLVFLPHLLPL